MKCLGFGFLCDPLRPLRFRAVSKPAPKRPILAHHLPAPQQQEKLSRKKERRRPEKNPIFDSAPPRRVADRAEERSGHSELIRVIRDQSSCDRPDALISRYSVMNRFSSSFAPSKQP